MFRLVEPVSGSIMIDGEDLSRMGLHDCRSKVVPTPLIRPFFTVVEGATVHYFPFSLFLSEEFGDILILSQSNKP
jgi:ABC-type transport system involved in Fe-S cluster assembly fused permease/ATPase subunit